MKVKYIFFAAMAIGLVACDNYFDEKHLQNGKQSLTDVHTVMYTLEAGDYKTIASNADNIQRALDADDDSTAYKALQKISNDKAFNELATADMYVPPFVALKFPYLDPGSKCDITYRIITGKPAHMLPFQNYVRDYTLSEQDYRTIWGVKSVKYLTPDTEAGIAELLATEFNMADSGALAIVAYDYEPYEPSAIQEDLPFEISLATLLRTKDDDEHQISGVVATVKSNLAGIFFLRDGNDSITVNGLKNDAGKSAWRELKLKSGDQLTLRGVYQENDKGEPYISNALYVSHISADEGGESQAGVAPRRRAAMLSAGQKRVIWQRGADKWAPYSNDKATRILVLPQEVYDQLGGNIGTPETTIPTWLAANYPLAKAKDIYDVAYKNKDGNYTADRFIHDGNAFVMQTGVETETMSFLYKQNWQANLSTYYTTPFVGDGIADFTLQAVNLDGLNYIWRYQSLYGMTASGYVSGTNHEIEGWLVSPPIRLKNAKQPKLTFDHAIRYGNTENNLQWLKVNVTDNYTGDVTTTQWKHLAFPDSIPDGSNFVFLSAGEFDLSEYNNQTIVIGFQYNTAGCNGQSVPTWEIQNLLVFEPEEQQ